MAPQKQRKTVWVLMILTVILILNCCAYQHSQKQPAPGVPPAPVDITYEIPVPVPDTPDSEISEPPEPEPEPRFYLHKVRWPEETLSHISKWYTGTTTNWKDIAKVNSELDPKKIGAGDMISIPEHLLITRKPMPHSLVSSTDRKNGNSLSSSIKTSTPSESPKLFGPIETQPLAIEPDAVKLFGPVE